MLKRILLFALLVTSLFTGCNKDDETVNREKILGTWISDDYIDTLEFTDKASFLKIRIILIIRFIMIPLGLPIPVCC